MQSTIITMARELLAIDADLPSHFDYRSYPDERPTADDFELYTFTQTWGSTALGFSGIGGQSMTQARTYVFIPQFVHQNCFVYFGSRFAYAIPYSEMFFEDVKKQNIASVSRRGKYLVNNKDDC